MPLILTTPNESQSHLFLKDIIILLYKYSYLDFIYYEHTISTRQNITYSLASSKLASVYSFKMSPKTTKITLLSPKTTKITFNNDPSLNFHPFFSYQFHCGSILSYYQAMLHAINNKCEVTVTLNCNVV